MGATYGEGGKTTTARMVNSIDLICLLMSY